MSTDCENSFVKFAKDCEVSEEMFTITHTLAHKSASAVRK